MAGGFTERRLLSFISWMVEDSPGYLKKELLCLFLGFF